MQRLAHADALIARVLCVDKQTQDAPQAARSATRTLNASLLFSALRCTVQYIILPFVLPLIGLATSPPIGLVLALDAIALGSIVASLRRLWRAQHPRRWNYLPLAAAVALAIIIFLAYDIRVLMFSP